MTKGRREWPTSTPQNQPGRKRRAPPGVNAGVEAQGVGSGQEGRGGAGVFQVTYDGAWRVLGFVAAEGRARPWQRAANFVR
jgi:hypothetical protein